MLREYKQTETTINHFINAIQATVDVEQAKFFKEEQSLVGVYLDTVFLPHPVIAHPVLKVNGISDDLDSISLEISLKPGHSEKDSIDMMGTLLSRTGLGELVTPVLDLKPGDTADNPMGRFNIQSTAVSDVEDIDVLLHFNMGKVHKQEFKIAGVQYTQYELPARGYIEGQPHEQSLFVLFKDKESDAESFFSTFVNEKLNKTDTDKVLTSIANENISGFGLGGINAFTKQTNTVFSFIPYMSELLLMKNDRLYGFKSLEGEVNIKHEDVEGLTVRFTGDRNYILELETKDMIVQVMIA